MSISVQQILDASAPASLFCSRHHAFATVPFGAFAQQAVPLHSPGFRHWLIQQCCDRYDAAPTAQALGHVVRVLQARARFSPSAQLHNRLAALPGRLVLDLNSPTTEVVDITPAGWSVDLAPDVFFRSGRNALSLPAPIAAAATPFAARLAEILNVRPADMPVILAWLLAALRPTGPYPILILKGPPGAGKSTAAEILRSLIDPRQPALRPVPARANRLRSLALENHVLAFDDIAALPPHIAETLAAISTGDCFDLDDRLGPAAEPAQIEIQRPIILVLSPHARSPLPGGLADRAISIELPEIRPSQRRTAADITGAFQRLHPILLGQLCDSLSAALAGHASIRLDTAPRFADAAAWIAAAAPALLVPPHHLIAALDRRDVDPLARTVYALLESQSPWTGTATALLDALATIAPVPWATNARGLSQRLRACSIPGVRAAFAHTETGSRITLELLADGDFDFAAKAPSVTAAREPQPSETTTLPQPRGNKQKNSGSPSARPPRANGVAHDPRPPTVSGATLVPITHP